MSLSVSKKATEVEVMQEKINGPLIKVLYFLYNPASFIPAWTPTESILLFNWLLNQVLGLSFLLHHFFQFQHGILEFEMLKTSLFSVMTFGCNIFQLFTTMLLEKRNPPHVSVICFKNAWISAKVHFVDYTI